MNCKDFQEIADSYLSDELLTETNHDMIRHMEACGDCRALIGARREIRSRLKAAVLGSSEYCLDQNFDHMLRTRLNHEFGQQNGATAGSWFGIRIFAMAAGLLVVAMLSFVLITNFNQAPMVAFAVPGFAENSLINIASGDHQHCAIQHDLEERPVSLSEGDVMYSGLDDLVKEKLETTLTDHKLVEAHACKYKDVRFAHLVMEGPSKTLSVLVAPSDQDRKAVDEKISGFASDRYQVSRFEAENNSVFVISNHSGENNKKAAKALLDPLRKHFAGRSEVQTAMMVSYGPD